MKPNILLIILDSARAQNMSLYDYERDTTPKLESFADNATVYEQARAPARWSYPSHVSLFTGYNTSQHGIHDEQYRFDGPTVWDTLSEAGYETALFSFNVFLTDKSFGLRNSFDKVVGQLDTPYEDGADPNEADGYLEFLGTALDSKSVSKSLVNGIVTKIRYARGTTGRNHGDVYVDRFSDWTSGITRPWAACINLMDTHFPYTPDKEHNIWGSPDGQQVRDAIDKMSVDAQVASDDAVDELVALYDGSIRQTDTLVGRLLDRVDLENTCVIVTADHGEAFGEFSQIRENTKLFGHAYGLGEALLHVPLVVKSPNQINGKRVAKLASLVEFPSVVESWLQRVESPTDFTVERAYASTHKTHHVGELPDSVPGQFNGESYALYEQVDGDIHKHLWWNDQEVTIVLKGNEKAKKEGKYGVLEAFSALDPVDTTLRTKSDLPDSTEESLRDLGYL